MELIDILELAKKHPMPEVNLIDIVFQGVALELKTVNTNYSFPGVSSKGKPISKNVVSVLDDIKKLKRRKSLTGFVIFIVFPCSHSNKRWAKHFVKIQSKLTNEKHHDFSFKNGVPGVIYYGQV